MNDNHFESIDNELNLLELVSASADATELAIRHDLREPAFRKYEQYIADACNTGSFTLTPLLPDKSGKLKPVKADTFVTRFSDAILAYRRYSYPSSLIPPNYDLSYIKARALANGKVLISNRLKDQQLSAKASLLRAGDPACRSALISAIAQTNAHNTSPTCTHPTILYVTCVSDDEFTLLELLTEDTSCNVKRHTNTIAEIW